MFIPLASKEPSVVFAAAQLRVRMAADADRLVALAAALSPEPVRRSLRLRTAFLSTALASLAMPAS